MSKTSLAGLDPLKDLLGDVLSRLEALEAKVGIKSGSGGGGGSGGSSSSAMPKQTSKSNVTSLNGKSRKD